MAKSSAGILFCSIFALSVLENGAILKAPSGMRNQALGHSSVQYFCAVCTGRLYHSELTERLDGPSGRIEVAALFELSRALLLKSGLF
jgi:hypothetical protein